MKALTICQPYAEMIAAGEKLIENRTWPTAYRGLLAIHAGKSRAWLEDDDEAERPGMAFGAVIAIARLVDCVRVEQVSEQFLTDYDQHHHANGPWCWVLSDVERVLPISISGAQGLWTVPSGVADAIGRLAWRIDARSRVDDTPEREP